MSGRKTVHPEGTFRWHLKRGSKMVGFAILTLVGWLAYPIGTEGGGDGW